VFYFDGSASYLMQRRQLLHEKQLEMTVSGGLADLKAQLGGFRQATFWM
jgi:hypothetical protein